MVVANRTTPTEWNWGGSGNFVAVSREKFYEDGDGLVVDNEQKPIDLYRQIIGASTSEQQWILDACSGTGG